MNRPRLDLRALLVFAQLVSVYSFGTACAGEQLSEEQASEAVRQTLGQPRSFPWYDASKDDVKPVRLRIQKPIDARHRDSVWEGQTSSNPKSTWSWGGFSSFMEGLTWVVLGGGLVLVIALLFWAATSRGSSSAALAAASEQEQDSMAQRQQRIENLPFQLNTPKHDLLAAVERFRDAGNYRDAIIYLFSHMLVHLDEHGLIRLTKGKTNRQYLREIRRFQELRQTLEHTMIAFEEVFFGDRSIDNRRFESCWNQLDQFHQKATSVHQSPA